MLVNDAKFRFTVYFGSIGIKKVIFMEWDSFRSVNAIILLLSMLSISCSKHSFDPNERIEWMKENFERNSNSIIKIKNQLEEHDCIAGLDANGAVYNLENCNTASVDDEDFSSRWTSMLAKANISFAECDNSRCLFAVFSDVYEMTELTGAYQYSHENIVDNRCEDVNFSEPKGNSCATQLSEGWYMTVIWYRLKK